MIRFLLLLSFTMPVYAGVKLLDRPMPDNKETNKGWVYDDGLFKIILTDKTVNACKGLRLVHTISVGDYVKNGCWQEEDSLVHIEYVNGQRSAISSEKFKRITDVKNLDW